MDTQLKVETGTEMIVHFVNSNEEYSNNEDITCYFMYDEKKPESSQCDRVAIMKLGWKYLKHFEMFEFVTDSDSYNTSDTPCVTFRREEFPDSFLEAENLFQFCYIHKEKTLLGVGTPFQIINSHIKEKDPELPQPIEQMTQIKKELSSKKKEILDLKDENAMLRECLKSAFDVTKNKKSLNYDDEIGELKDLVSTLRSAMIIQQKQIDTIKDELKKEQEQRRLFTKIHIEAYNRPIKGGTFDLTDLETLPPCPL